jgi:hypothetical protein
MAPATKQAPREVLEPFVPRTAVPTIAVDAAPGECPALPQPPAEASESVKRAAVLAAAVRRLACEPALFAEPVAELRATLGLPAEIELTFVDPAGVTLRADPPPGARELATALGIDEPVARLRWNAYHDEWTMGSHPKTGALSGFSPGVITISVQGPDAVDGDPEGKVIPITDDMTLQATIGVGLADGLVAMQPDPEGVRQLATALRILAADPARLADEPAKVEASLRLGGERFRVARVSTHSGDGKIDGISIQPMRTAIPADELASALGLEDARAVNVNREHGVWEVEAGDTTQLAWEGVELQIQVDPADDRAQTAPLEGGLVGFVSMKPRASEP